MRIPYSLALERSDIQRGILVAATRGLDSLEGVDWAAVDAQVERLLVPLVDAA
jgi:kynurenine 3-monooxygenase